MTKNNNLHKLNNNLNYNRIIHKNNPSNPKNNPFNHKNLKKKMKNFDMDHKKIKNKSKITVHKKSI